MSAAPSDAYTTGTFTINPATFRYLRYLAPSGSYGNVAEIEFDSVTAGAATKLTGTAFGTAGSYNNDGNVYGNVFGNALDGNTGTFFNAPAPGSGDFVGIDRGAPVLSGITVSPATASLNLNKTQAFTAVAKDQYGAALATQPSFTWTVASGGVGSVSASGVYSSGSSAGSASVKAASGSVSGTASVTVTNAAPTVATAAKANPSPATGTTSALSVLGADDGGEGSLTYTWATTGTPPAAVTFSVNGTNAAKSATATFTKAGSYSLQATIKDAAGLTTTSAVSVSVSQTLTSIAVTPSAVTLTTGGTQTFTGSAKDQFGAALATQPALTWSVVSGGVGSITSGGVYSAGSAAGSATVKAVSGSISGTAAVTVNPASTLAAPSLTAAATGANKITLYWNGVSGASSYNVYRSTTSGGPYAQIASGTATADPGPGMTGNFTYSDTAGLATGTEYFYIVTAVQSGTEGPQSNEASAIPDPSAIAWDSGNAPLIVSQVGSMVANNLANDESAAGELTIGGPNGVIYQSFQNGSPAQAYASPGHYSVSNRTLVYADGNEVPAPIDTSDSDPGMPATTSSSAEQSAISASATASLKFKQSLGHPYNPTAPPSGIFREVQTQPGYSSLLSYIGLPDVMDTSLSYIDSRKYQPGKSNSSIFPASDTGYIYSGGTAYTIVTGKNGTTTYKSELDAGLMLVRTDDAAHPGWVPVINAPGFTFDAGFVGYPLEYDSAAAQAGCTPYPQVFVSGEPLMSFKAAGFGTIPDGVVVMSFHAGTGGNVFRLVNGVKTQVGDITLVRGGIRGWNRKAQIVIKRMNSIAQNIKRLPGQTTYTPAPNGPGGGFNSSGSFVKGASWGDINGDDDVIDGVNVFPYGQWDTGLTWQEGSYPVGNPYMGYLVQNQFFWEQYINLHT